MSSQFEPQYLIDLERQQRPPFYVHPMDAIEPPPRRCPPKPAAPLPDVADLCPAHRVCRAQLGLPVARYCGYTGLRLEDGRPAWMGCQKMQGVADGE